MAPRPKRNRQNRARHEPPQSRLEDDLKRHRLAREVIPDVIDAAEHFLAYFPRVVGRRVSNRIVLLSDLASDVLAWTALGAPADKDQLPVRCFATSCMLVNHPHTIAWRTLAMSGLGADVRTYVGAFAVQVPELPQAPPDPGWPHPELESVVDQLRAFVGQLRAQQATSADGLRLGRQLLESAIWLDPVLAREGVVGNLMAVAAHGLLERTLPPHDQDDRLFVVAILEDMAEAVPGLVEHAAAHLEDDYEEEPEDEMRTEPDDGSSEVVEEDDEGEDLALDDALTVLDARLSMTEQASQGADVAFLAAGSLLLEAVRELRPLPPTFGPRVRAIAASDALLSTGGKEHGVDSLEVGEGSALLESAYSRAAALLEADVPGKPQAEQPAEPALSELDHLLRAMLDVAGNESVEGLAGALALIAGAAQTLRAGGGLGHEDPDKQRRMAAALGALDPLALADRPESRAAAAQTLRELARSRRPTTTKSTAAG